MPEICYRRADRRWCQGIVRLNREGPDGACPLSCSDGCRSLTLLRAIQHVDDVAHVLFVADAFDVFGGKFDLPAEVAGEFGEQFDAGLRIEIVPAQQGLQGNRSLRRAHLLA